VPLLVACVGEDDEVVGTDTKPLLIGCNGPMSGKKTGK
jgi:hypothetical protein